MRFTLYVVQLPDELPVCTQTKFLTPVIYAERRGKEISGWVHYLDREHRKANRLTSF